MIQNMKIGKKISIFVMVLLVVGLTILASIVIVNLRSGMKDSARDRFSELADARASVVETYFEGYKGYVAGFAGLGSVKELLKNTADEAAKQEADKVLNEYYATRSGMEGLYALDTNGICLIHNNPAALGVQVIKGEPDLTNYKNYLSDGQWVKGISPSTQTGELVAVCYSGAYDENNKFIGYIGAAAYITTLTDRLDKMDLNGLDNAEVWLLNLNANNYVVVPDSHSDLFGQEIQRELDKKIASEAKSTSENTFDYADEDGKRTVAYKLIPSLNYVVVITAPESEVMATASSTARIIIIISVIILAIMAIMAALIASGIGKEISGVGKIIKNLGTLDLTQAKKLKAYSGRRDEVGMIADAAITLSGAIGESVRNLSESAEKLRVESEQLSSNTQDTVNSLSQIDRAVHDIAEGATSQAVETQHATSAVSSIGEKVENTIDSAKKLKGAAEALKTSSGKAKKILGELSDINEETKVSVSVIYEQTNETNSSAERISEATALISSIADQTNLLSLNASIEAARAGESGRGFAVVAEEIGHLAEQSSESAKQIEQIISALVESSQRAVSTMDKVRETMEKQNEYIEKTKEIFGDVDREIGVSMAGINEISGNVSELDNARQTLSDCVASLSAIAEENAASTEQTSATTSVVNEMIGDVSGIAGRVSEVAGNIKKDIEVYKI